MPITSRVSPDESHIVYVVNLHASLPKHLTNVWRSKATGEYITFEKSTATACRLQRTPGLKLTLDAYTAIIGSGEFEPMWRSRL